MKLVNIFNQALGYFLLKEVEVDDSLSDEEILDDAQQRLKEARNTFSNIDPDFMDYAIYNLRAAEERYNILIKQAKEK